jgi:hypothetical protein
MESFYNSKEFFDDKGNVISSDEFNIAVQSYVNSSTYTDDFSTFQDFLENEWFSDCSADLALKSSTTSCSPSDCNNTRCIDDTAQPSIDCGGHTVVDNALKSSVLPSFVELLTEYVNLIVRYKTHDIRMSDKALTEETKVIVANIDMWKLKMTSQYNMSRSAADSWVNMYYGDTLSLMSIIEDYRLPEEKRNYRRTNDLEDKLRISSTEKIPGFWEPYIQSIDALSDYWTSLFELLVDLAKFFDDAGGSESVSGIHRQGSQYASLIGSIFESELGGVIDVSIASSSQKQQQPDASILTSWLSTFRTEYDNTDTKINNSKQNEGQIIDKIYQKQEEMSNNSTTTKGTINNIESMDQIIDKHTKAVTYALINISKFSNDRDEYQRLLASNDGIKSVYKEFVSIQNQMEANIATSSNRIKLSRDSVFDQKKLDTLSPRDRSHLYTSFSVITLLRDLHFTNEFIKSDLSIASEIAASTPGGSVLSASPSKIDSLADSAVMKNLQKLAVSILARLKGGDIPSLLNDFTNQLESDDNSDFLNAGYSIATDTLKLVLKKSNKTDGSRVQVLVILCAALIKAIGKQKDLKSSTLEYIKYYLSKSPVSSTIIEHEENDDDDEDSSDDEDDDKRPSIQLIEGLFSKKKTDTTSTTTTKKTSQPAKSKGEDVNGSALSSKTAKNISSRMAEFIQDAEKMEFRLDNANVKAREVALNTIKKTGVSGHLSKVVLLCIGIILQCQNEAGNTAIYESGKEPKWVRDYIKSVTEQLIADINL